MTKAANIPEGLRPILSGITEYLEMLDQMKRRMGNALRTDTPEGWLLKHGEAMGPNVKRPKGLRLMKQKECFSNSAKTLMFLDLDPNEWFYAEGYAASTELAIPIAHAWLTNREGEVIDRTWRRKPGEAIYFGVPFKQRYLNETLCRTGYFGLFYPDGMMFNRHLLEDDPAEFRAWEKKV